MDTELAETASADRLPIPVPDHMVMKLTRGHSCVLCQQRKVRCDKQKPCANCVKAQVECRVLPPQPPRRRKKKPHERDLVDRLRKYEALLSQHGVTFEPISQDFRAGPDAEDFADLEHDLRSLKTSPGSSAPDHNVDDGQSPDHKQKWFPFYKEYRATGEPIDSSDEDYEGPTIHHAFDTMFENSDGFPFTVGGSPASVTTSHPSAIQIFQLWQIYIVNVNPLLKISHVPTLQGQIIAAGANTAKISKPLEALMFSIYLISLTSMRDDEVQSTFGEDRNVLLARYHTASQQALVNASFMRSTEIMVLQAYFLHLLSVRQYVDPRSLFCLIGIAVRIATRLGLQRDGVQFGLPPFETEQRRRLWWQIVAFDKRIAEITGSTITALSSSGGDCRLPLNINDTDLNIHAKDMPTPYVGATEMIFCLTRLELAVAASPTGIRPVTGNKPRVQFSPSPSSPDVVTHVAMHNLPQDLDGYCNYIESVYLKHCDPKIPLHFFALTMTRQSLSKLRVINFMCRGVPTESISPEDRDALFEEAVRVVEYDSLLWSTESVRGFSWYTHMFFPLPIYIFLVSELKSNRHTGELCDRAWDAIIENHDRRGLIRNLRSPLHVAIGALLVKAWDARTAAEAQLGRHLQPPKLVNLLRQNMSRGQKPRNSAGGPPGAADMGMGPGPPDMGGMGGPNPFAMGTGVKPPAPAAQAADVPLNAMGGGNGVGAGAGAGAGMMLDDTMMFNQQYSGGEQMFGSGIQSPEVDLGQVDWVQFMQLGGMPGFGGGGAGMPGFGPGTASHIHHGGP